jgi:hypothetical protein
MKKLVFLICLATLTVFVACNRDDNPVKNQIFFDDIDLEEYAGYYDDYGTYCLIGGSRSEGGVPCETHLTTAFVITDGTFGLEDYGPSDYTYQLQFELHTPNGSPIAGTYEIMPDWEIYQSDQTGNFLGGYYTYPYFPEWAQGCCIGSVEGTIKVSGKMPNLTMEFDLTIGYYAYAQEVPRQEEAVNAYVDITGRYKGEFLERMIGD